MMGDDSHTHEKSTPTTIRRRTTIVATVLGGFLLVFGLLTGTALSSGYLKVDLFGSVERPQGQLEALLEQPEPTPNTPQTEATSAAQPTPPISTPKAPAIDPAPTPTSTYTNSDGLRVSSPYHAPAAPAGASAQCRDGTYSFSQHRSGTCSHHGGVSQWL